MNCEVCQAMRQTLEQRKGLRITSKMIDEIFGVKVALPTTCDECDNTYLYAKGKCCKHYMQQYMASRRGPKIERSKVCSKCENPIHAKGLCHGHYMEARWYARHLQKQEVKQNIDQEVSQAIEQAIKQELEQETNQDTELSKYQEYQDKSENEKS